MTGHRTTPAGSLFEERCRKALALLAECLNDPEPWPEDDLVQRMEAVFLALGGVIEEGEARV